MERPALIRNIPFSEPHLLVNLVDYEMLAEMDKGIVSFLSQHQDPRMIYNYGEYQTARSKNILDGVQKLSEFAPNLIINEA